MCNVYRHVDGCDSVMSAIDMWMVAIPLAGERRSEPAWAPIGYKRFMQSGRQGACAIV